MLNKTSSHDKPSFESFQGKLKYRAESCRMEPQFGSSRTTSGIPSQAESSTEPRPELSRAELTFEPSRPDLTESLTEPESSLEPS